MEDQIEQKVLDLADIAKLRAARLGTVESCTGGAIASAITDIAGSSEWFEGALITYSNHLKSQLARVPEALLKRYGAVSEPVAKAMAQGGLSALGVTCCIAVTGIAGPGGGSSRKPVGMACFGWAAQGLEARVETVYFDGDRQHIRQSCVLHGLAGMTSMLAGE